MVAANVAAAVLVAGDSPGLGSTSTFGLTSGLGSGLTLVLLRVSTDGAAKVIQIRLYPLEFF